MCNDSLKPAGNIGNRMYTQYDVLLHPSGIPTYLHIVPVRLSPAKLRVVSIHSPDDGSEKERPTTNPKVSIDNEKSGGCWVSLNPLLLLL
jgi:hypothetical protein